MKKALVSFANRIGGLFGPGPNPLGNDFERIYPSDAELNDDLEFNRFFAEGSEADAVESSRLTALTIVEQAKWLLASLVTVNLAGVFAPLQIEEELGLRAVALCFFVSGILMALLSAFAGIRAGLSLSAKMGEPKGYWRAVRMNGYRFREMELDHARVVGKALQLARLPYGLGFGSVACFLGGCVTLAAILM